MADRFKADTLFGIYCDGKPIILDDDQTIFWEGWQRLADWLNAVAERPAPEAPPRNPFQLAQDSCTHQLFACNSGPYASVCVLCNKFFVAGSTEAGTLNSPIGVYQHSGKTVFIMRLGSPEIHQCGICKITGPSVEIQSHVEANICRSPTEAEDCPECGSNAKNLLRDSCMERQLNGGRPNEWHKVFSGAGTPQEGE